MHDFDVERKKREERDRSFKIGGEEFVYKPAVAPEVLLKWSQVAEGQVLTTNDEWLGELDNTIVAMLEPGQAEKWAKVRAPDVAHPINVADLQDVVQWLVEQVVSRPTGQPSVSSAGPPATATASTGGSSSQAAQASTGSPRVRPQTSRSPSSRKR